MILYKIFLIVPLVIITITPSFAFNVHAPDGSEFTWEEVHYRSGKRAWKAKATKDEIEWNGIIDADVANEDPRKLTFVKKHSWIQQDGAYSLLSYRYDVYDERRADDDFWGRSITMNAQVVGYVRYIDNQHGSDELTNKVMPTFTKGKKL